ncbi:PDT-domain-containing protein [Ascodesmis nigricans]|uniref:prephenate dehydratase n=1 Tax=Ascodesmis nigricans TaxID=341454 RepID=A0A4S2MRS3_9PEZI|nr:PDT-domain-containing protein [Ascodesmis nigricans]
MSSLASLPPDAPSVAFLGPTSTNTHQAALERFNVRTHKFVAQTTIGDIFTAVQTGSCQYGVVPFENSTNGSVIFTLDLFRAARTAYPNIRITGETYFHVHHCFLSLTPEIRDVKRIYSHQQAFGQCETWINSMVKGKEKIEVSSTARAAEIAKQEGVGAAAIASKLAADAHGLKVLARNIEDATNNTTRFFILERLPDEEVDGGGGGAAAPRAIEISQTKPRKGSLTHPSTGEGSRDKTLLCFTCDHEQPGALCDSLKVFKDKGLNLTGIQSRPSRTKNWSYIFFVEFVGHEEEPAVQEALKELEKFTQDMMVLGSYQDKSPKN